MGRSPRTFLSAVVVLGGTMIGGAESLAQSLTPVVISLIGTQPVLVEVASGVVRPCDSTSNQWLYRAKMVPGETVTLQSPTACICWRQTYDNFPDANWSPPRITCNTGWVCRGRRCVRDRDPVLRLSLVSTDPRW